MNFSSALSETWRTLQREKDQHILHSPSVILDDASGKPCPLCQGTHIYMYYRVHFLTSNQEMYPINFVCLFVFLENLTSGGHEVWYSCLSLLIPCGSWQSDRSEKISSICNMQTYFYSRFIGYAQSPLPTKEAITGYQLHVCVCVKWLHKGSIFS